MPAAELGASAAKSRSEKKGEEEQVIEASFAYLVYQRKDTGQFVLTPNLDAPVTTDRAPTHDEVFGSMAVVQKDIQGQQFAGMAAQAQLQINNFMAQQMQGQADLDKLVADGGLRVGG